MPIARLVLVCAVLLASLGLGCSKLEQLDQESNHLLDKINDPSPSSSSRSSGQATGSGSSGLTVVKRKADPYTTVHDARGNPVGLWGQANSSSTTPGHADTIAATAVEMAFSGQYEYITMQRSWRTATGRVSTSTRIPDLIGVRHDGKVDAFEVKSKSDKKADLWQRLEEGMNTLPPERRGRYNVIEIDL